MKFRGFARLFPLFCMTGNFLLSNTLVHFVENWIIVEAVILTIVLLSSILLPGAPSLWLFLLGTAGTLPVLWFLLPPSIFFEATAWPLALLFHVVYFVLSAAFATLGPMLLLLLM